MLDNIAKEISELDFSTVDPDNTDEAIYNLAIDLYNLSDSDANKVVNILMNKYIKNLN